MWLTLAIKNWKLIAIAVVAVALVSTGIWFRGVLAENTELAAQNKLQALEVANLNHEVERMNKQDALDYSLRQMIEIEKAKLKEDLIINQQRLKRAKELLDHATQSCLDMPLPQSYLDRLPQNKDQVRP